MDPERIELSFAGRKPAVFPLDDEPKTLVRGGRIERPTSALSRQRSAALSYPRTGAPRRCRTSLTELQIQRIASNACGAWSQRGASNSGHILTKEALFRLSYAGLEPEGIIEIPNLGFTKAVLCRLSYSG